MWVRSARVELVRGDRIVSVAVPDSTKTGGASTAQVADDSPVSLEAVVTGGLDGDSMRWVPLVQCSGKSLARMATSLVSALAQACASAHDSARFVYPEPNAGDGGEPGWTVARELPGEWPA